MRRRPPLQASPQARPHCSTSGDAACLPGPWCVTQPTAAIALSACRLALSLHSTFQRGAWPAAPAPGRQQGTPQHAHEAMAPCPSALHSCQPCAVPVSACMKLPARPQARTAAPHTHAVHSHRLHARYLRLHAPPAACLVFLLMAAPCVFGTAPCVLSPPVCPARLVLLLATLVAAPGASTFAAAPCACVLSPPVGTAGLDRPERGLPGLCAQSSLF